MSPQAKTQRITLTLVVDYELNGVDPNVMKNNLENLCMAAIGDGMLTGYTDALVDTYRMNATVHKEGPFPLSVSLDGGVTYTEAKEGVRVAYLAHVPGEDEKGELHINMTHEGIVKDIYVSREEHLDHNLATSSILIEDLMSDMIEQSE